MTSDGELKRQIFQLDYVQIDTIKVENLGDVLGEKINEILDEVAKEFPRAILPIDAGVEYHENAMELLRLISDWYLKWFGDPV
jgi:hypothetical protein